MPCLRINPRLLPIKLHFLLFFAAAAPILPFLPVYAQQLGIDALGVGVVFAGLFLQFFIQSTLSKMTMPKP